jgi:hypothetical protein
VKEGVYDAFTKRLAETAGAIKVADGEVGCDDRAVDRPEGCRKGRGAHRGTGLTLLESMIALD